jgi:hypothetical protein
MGACGYVTPVMKIKQEIIDLTLELESMGKEKEFCHLVLEEDVLNFYKNDAMDRDEKGEKS